MTILPEAGERPLEILLVEDNPGDARLIEKNLTRTDPRLLGGDVEVTRAVNLSDAMALIRENEFSAILLDLGLPECNGLETLKRLLTHSSRSPVVILTGLQDEDLAFQAVREGAEDFLHKDDLGGERLARSLRYAIERHQRKLQTNVIEAAKMALLLVELTEPEPTVILVNRACEKLMGYSLEEWQEQGMSSFLSGPSSDEVMPAFREAAETGQMRLVEQRTYRPDGTWFWNEIQAIPITDIQTTHILYSFEDITEKLKWRAKMVELDRMTTLGTVADGLAHEINNPLSFITANIEFVLRTIRTELTPEDREKVEEALEDAMEGSRRIRSVVGDLQQLAGRPKDVRFSREEIDPISALKRSLTIVRNFVQDRARLVYNLQDLPDVLANEPKLGQVFLNILVNASQSIASGNAESNQVTISSFQRNQEVVISIADTGCGISEKDQKRLFEPFYSTQNASEGTGLGMPISQQILTQLDGYFEIESTVGVGTVVSVVLPVANAMVHTPESND